MIQPDFRLIIAMILLLVLGCCHAWVSAKMERKRYLEGYHWLGMATGAALTLACVAIVDWHSATLAAGAFLISGTPIALGEIWRYMRARELEQQFERQTPRVAK